MAGAANVGHLADGNDVSRKFVYQQKTKARYALEDAYLRTTGGVDVVVLFYLPVTKAWLHQVALALTLISHSSYHGGVEFLRDILSVCINAGGVHNLHQLAARRAGETNRAQDLSCIRDGLHDEIFNCNEPVLVGVEAHPTYSYLLAAADHRDADTWDIHLMYACDQGFHPDYLVAGEGTGLRAGQAIVWKCQRLLGPALFRLSERGFGFRLLLSSVTPQEGRPAAFLGRLN